MPIKAATPVINKLGNGLSYLSILSTGKRIIYQDSIGFGDAVELAVDFCGLSPTTSFIPVIYFVADTGYSMFSNGHTIADKLNKKCKYSIKF